MTESDLSAAGYRRYSGNGRWSNADHFHQKVIRSPDGRTKLYFIDIGVWDFSRFDRFPEDQDPIRFEAEATLYRGRDRLYRVCIPVGPGDTVAGIEAEFARAYAALGCVPDIHNNDSE